jgi:hypothetical protein
MMTINTRTADGRRQLRDQFRTVLLAAAKERGKRPEAIHTEFGPEWEWMRFEREAMLAAVNDERARRNLPPVTAGQVQTANIQAGGHVDYADKFALYCAEIAMGIERTTY